MQLILLAILIGIYNSAGDTIIGTWCSFPGTPYNGNLEPFRQMYSAGDTIRYSCNHQLKLRGYSINQCLPSGQWKYSKYPPLCLTEVATGKATEQSTTAFGFNSLLAVDDNYQSCSKTQPKISATTQTSQWWKVNLGAKYVVMWVYVKVRISISRQSPVHIGKIEILNDDSEKKEHLCNNVTSTSSGKEYVENMIPCNWSKFYQGDYVRISTEHDDPLQLCEVKVYVKPDFPFCGMPEVGPHCETEVSGFNNGRPEKVIYKAESGYKMIGGVVERTCSQDGVWTGTLPLCIPNVFCSFPGTPYRGTIEPFREMYSVGDSIKFRCNPHLKLKGYSTNECLETGKWKYDKYPPVCLTDVATGRPTQQSTTEQGFDSSLAVDSNSMTCSKTQGRIGNESQWWKVNLGAKYVVTWVYLKARISISRRSPLFVAKINVLNNSNKEKEHFCHNAMLQSRGREYVEDTVHCMSASFYRDGDYLSISFDDDEPLQLCEVKVYIKPDFPFCGMPEVSPHCEAEQQVNGMSGGRPEKAIYTAKPGYRIVKGDTERTCSTDGVWHGESPLCIAITQETTSDNSVKPPSPVDKETPQETPNAQNTNNNDVAIGVSVAALVTVLVIFGYCIYNRIKEKRSARIKPHNQVIFNNTLPPVNHYSKDPQRPDSERIYEEIDESQFDDNTDRYGYVKPNLSPEYLPMKGGPFQN